MIRHVFPSSITFECFDLRTSLILNQGLLKIPFHENYLSELRKIIIQKDKVPYILMRGNSKYE